MTYLQEYCSNIDPTMTIISHLSTFMKTHETNTIAKEVKKSNISIEYLFKELELKANDNAFVRF